MAHEIRITLSDEAYDELLAQASAHQEDVTVLAARLLADDIAEQRFARGAQQFIDEHADRFAARFGPADGRRDAA